MLLDKKRNEQDRYLAMLESAELYYDDPNIPPDVKQANLRVMGEHICGLADNLKAASERLTRSAEQRDEAEAGEQKSPNCTPTQHSWKITYYGYKCDHCSMFIPSGCEPWLPLDV